MGLVLRLALTRVWGPVIAAVAGGPPPHVTGALRSPEAAIIEADDIIEPVRHTGHAGWCAVWGRAPVMATVWGAATGGISR